MTFFSSLGSFGNQQDLDFFFNGSGARLQRGNLFLGHRAHIGVCLGQHRARLRQALLHLLQFAILLHRLFNFAQRLGGLLILLVVVDHLRQRKLRLQIVVPLLHLFQAIKHFESPCRAGRTRNYCWLSI